MPLRDMTAGIGEEDSQSLAARGAFWDADIQRVLTVWSEHWFWTDTVGAVEEMCQITDG